MASVGETVSNAGKLIRRTVGAAMGSVHAGDEKLQIRRQGTAGTLTLRSSAFTAGGTIPDRYTPQGENVSPYLEWTGVPASARELVLIVEDPDAPLPKPFVHWVLRGLPPTTTSLPVGVPTTVTLPDGSTQGTNDFKQVGYGGPQPPLGHGVHHYHFQLFAMDAALSLSADATLADLAKAMAGRVIADGELVGTYERK